MEGEKGGKKTSTDFSLYLENTRQIEFGRLAFRMLFDQRNSEEDLVFLFLSNVSSEAAVMAQAQWVQVRNDTSSRCDLNLPLGSN